MDDTLLFAKYSKGYKAGSHQHRLCSRHLGRLEKVDVYEAGWKQEWGDTAFTTNSALFHYNYKDMQASVTQVIIDPASGLERNVGVLANIRKQPAPASNSKPAGARSTR